MKILLDNGHGADDLTNGKYSPITDIKDVTVFKNRFREGNFNRIVAKGIHDALVAEGYDVVLLVPERADVSLGERVRRANKFGKDSIFISVHANAAGHCDKFTNASGFSVFCANQCSSKSIKLAQLMTDAAHKRGLNGNRSIPSDKVWRANFYVIKNTSMPAVLTENLFYDNIGDLKILTSPEGRQKIIDLHVEAIKQYCEIYGK